MRKNWFDWIRSCGRAVARLATRSSAYAGGSTLAGTPTPHGIHFSAIRYDATTLAGGLYVPCTSEYAAYAIVAHAARDTPGELEALVSLVEMRALGHCCLD